MREGGFEQFNTPEDNPKIPKPETPEAPKAELAGGLDKDPRLGDIRAELIEEWERSTGKDILGPEGQDFLYGDPTAQKRGEEPMTIEKRAQEVFAKRFPEDAEAYAKKEKTRIYENPADDPAIREVEETITRIVNRDVEQIRKGMWGESAAKKASGMGYGGVWDGNFNRVNIQQWNDFLLRYPEKAAAYREKFEPIKRAFEGQERVRQYRKQREREERERVKTIDDDPTFRDFMDNPQTGLNARVWRGVSGEESLTGRQYYKKAEEIREQMMKEFATQYPEIAAQYGIETAQTGQAQEAASGAQETSQPNEAEEEIEVEVKPSRPEQILAKRIDDFERVKELRKGLGQEPGQKSEQAQRVEDFFFIFSSLREPHRFEIHSGTINQRTFEVKPGREWVIVTETDYRGDTRRWTVAQNGSITLIESGYGLREDVFPIEGQTLNKLILEVRTINRSEQEAIAELEELLKIFAEQVRKKAKTK